MTPITKQRLWWLQLILLSLYLSVSASVDAAASNIEATAAFIPTFLQTADAVATDYLRVEWIPAAVTSAVGIGAHGDGILAAEACTRLGESLRVGRGLGGMGLFDDFGCYMVRQPNQPRAAPFAGRASPSSGWVLRVRVLPQQLVLQMVYKPQSGAAFTVAKVVLAGSGFSPDLFNDTEYVQLTAALLLDKMPAARRLDLALAEPKSATGQVSEITETSTAAPSSDTGQLPAWVLFTWNYAPQDELWAPHVIGRAQMSQAPGKRTWQLHIDAGRGAPKIGAVYAQIAAGPGSRQGDLRAALDKRRDFLRERNSDEERAAAYAKLRTGVGNAANFLLHNSLESSYLSLRLGRELVNPKTAVFPPGDIIGLLGEIRSGFLTGLRFYFDWVPKHGATNNGEATYLEWRRFVCGYSLELPLHGFITRLEVIPKVGLWTVNSRLATVDSNDNIDYETFTLNNAFSVGGEAAVVRDTGRYQVRLWYARDLPTLVSNVNGIRRSVLSERYGGDATLRTSALIVKESQWRVSYQLFLYHDDVEYRQLSTQASSFSLDIGTVYGGGGVAVHW